MSFSDFMRGPRGGGSLREVPVKPDLKIAPIVG
jgi:hypothetical protein